MSTSTPTTAVASPDPAVAGPGTGPGPARAPAGARLLRFGSPRRIGAVYVLVLACIVFSVTASGTFPTTDTLRQVLNTGAISAIVAMALVLPLSAGVFDISIAFVMSLSGVLCTYLLVNTGLPIGLCVLAALLASLAIGAVNGFVIVVLKIDSLIATLATGSLLQAFITLISKDSSITDQKLLAGFADIGQADVNGFTLPILYVIVIAIGIWFVQRHTATGRRLYATGFNLEAARLANVRTGRLRFGTLVASAGIAGLAGIVLASTLGSGTPTAGTPYLLPAFAAVFLGATQLDQGRFNAWGTVLATVLLTTGTIGLSLSGAPTWAQSLFTGLVLLVALALTRRS
jgi:ribose transport system permease protein